MQGYSNRWKDFPDYIIAITREIWENRGIGTLNEYYSDDIIVRSPMGIQRGNVAVMAATMATINEFPDRELLADDVIWSDDPEFGLLSSHRINTRATHTRDGQFGPAEGKPWNAWVIADCAAKDGTIYDEWLIRDYGGIVRQLGFDPETYAGALIDAEGGPETASRPFTPDQDIDGGYNSHGNNNTWGQRYSETLQKIMSLDFDVIAKDYDRAVGCHYAGGISAYSHDTVTKFWLGLRSSFPDAKFKIHHQIGMDNAMLPPRASLRWSLEGIHSGWGSFGKPTGANVYVMGMCHAEYGPFVNKDGPQDATIRRECALYDEVAVWKQILMQKDTK